jgi:pimeloyl-ACP methyl ester carboxylesterase
MTTARNYSSIQSKVPEAAAPVRLKDGASIQTWVRDGWGTPLVFLYGLGCSIKHWKYQLQHAQDQGHLTVHMDYRGHGASSLGDPIRPLSIKTLSHDLRDVLDQLRIETAVILGQSMGGSVALQFAHDYPTRCSGLILQGSPGRDPYTHMRIGDTGRAALNLMMTLNKIAPDWVRFLNSAAGKAPAIAREVVRLKGFNPQLAKTEDIDEYLRHFFATDPNIFYELAEDLKDFDVSALPNLIEVPSLIIAGGKDNIVPVEECRWLAKRLPMAELEVMPHGSHCPHLDDPAYVNARIDRFLSAHNLR